MTEQEWLTCTDPAPMLEFLHGEVIALVDELSSKAERQAVRALLQGMTIPRKVALFACACCRQIWPALIDPRSRGAVEVAERATDGLVDEAKLASAALAAHDARNAIEHKRGTEAAETHIRRVAANACWKAASGACSARGRRTSLERAAEESADVATWIGVSADLLDARAKQAQFLRCVVGNPFRPSPPLPAAVLAWNDGTVRRIAESIYEERQLPEGTLDTGRLAILADALLDAGCDNEELIQHSRSPGPHVRGCWAIDLLTGKS